MGGCSSSSQPFTRFTTAVLAAVLVAGCGDQTGPTQLNPAFEAGVTEQASVSGQVKLEFTQFVGLYFVETYSFNATLGNDGVVRGRWQALDIFDDGLGNIVRLTVRGDITCFQLLPDGRAYIGGNITEGGGFPPGSEALWTVVDRAGSGLPDLSTDLTFGYAPGSGLAAAHCLNGNVPTVFPLTTIEGGDIRSNRASP